MPVLINPWLSHANGGGEYLVDVKHDVSTSEARFYSKVKMHFIRITGPTAQLLAENFQSINNISAFATFRASFSPGPGPRPRYQSRPPVTGPGHSLEFIACMVSLESFHLFHFLHAISTSELPVAVIPSPTKPLFSLDFITVSPTRPFIVWCVFCSFWSTVDDDSLPLYGRRGNN